MLTKYELKSYFKVILLQGKQQDSARTQTRVKLQWNVENYEVKAIYLHKNNFWVKKRWYDFSKIWHIPTKHQKANWPSYLSWSILIIAPNLRNDNEDCNPLDHDS